MTAVDQAVRSAAQVLAYARWGNRRRVAECAGQMQLDLFDALDEALAAERRELERTS